MRPSRVFLSPWPLTRHGNNGKWDPLRDEWQQGNNHPLNPYHSCSSCMSVHRQHAARSTQHISTPDMLLLAGQYDHAARLVLLIGYPV